MKYSIFFKIKNATKMKELCIFMKVNRSKLYRITCMLLFAILSSSSFAQVADLVIQKTGPTQVYRGQPMSYTIIIGNNGPTNVTNATFNDNLPAGITNVTYGGCVSTGGAVCPTILDYSISNTNFSGTIPFLPANATVTFTIYLNAPLSPGSSFTNTATVTPPSGITDPNNSTNSSTWNVTLLNKTDIEVIKTKSTNSSIGCAPNQDSITYTVIGLPFLFLFRHYIKK